MKSGARSLIVLGLLGPGLLLAPAEPAPSPSPTRAGASVSAARAPAEPGAALAALPSREAFVYRRRTGDAVDELVIELSRRSEGGRSWYELRSKTAEEEGLYVLSGPELALASSDVTTRSPDAVIRRRTEVLEDRSSLKPNQLLLSANPPFLQRLRFLPFADKPSYDVVFQGSAASSAFSLGLSVAARERVEAGGRSWDCWRLELGAKGALGALFGKTRYWYRADWPHVLVKSEGASGFPGSPPQRLELLSYSPVP